MPTRIAMAVLGVLNAPLSALAAVPSSPAPQLGRPFAAPEALGSSTPAGVMGLSQVIFALVVVLAAVFAVAWLVRRARGLSSRVGGAIDILADVPLGQKERAVLLQVGQTQILLGVAPGRVNALHVLPEPIQPTKVPARTGEAQPSFRALLMRGLGK